MTRDSFVFVAFYFFSISLIRAIMFIAIGETLLHRGCCDTSTAAVKFGRTECRALHSMQAKFMLHSFIFMLFQPFSNYIVVFRQIEISHQRTSSSHIFLSYHFFFFPIHTSTRHFGSVVLAFIHCFILAIILLY